jgi:50S ribosomal subunit-associated GTPase HflX
MPVLNKIDVAGALPPLATRGPATVSVSAMTGKGIEGLRDAIRHAILSAPEVAVLRVPLSEPEVVRRAVDMPHQLARRFEDGVVQLAMRVDPRRLTASGLDDYRVGGWDTAGLNGGR